MKTVGVSSRALPLSRRNLHVLAEQGVNELDRAGANKLAIQQITTEDRRLRTLQLLADAPGLTLNEDVIYHALPKTGHVPTADVLRNDLMWLAEVQLIALELTRPWVASLLQRGAEVATGRARAYGVAVPTLPIP